MPPSWIRSALFLIYPSSLPDGRIRHLIQSEVHLRWSNICSRNVSWALVGSGTCSCVRVGRRFHGETAGSPGLRGSQCARSEDLDDEASRPESLANATEVFAQNVHVSIDPSATPPRLPVAELREQACGHMADRELLAGACETG